MECDPNAKDENKRGAAKRFRNSWRIKCRHATRNYILTKRTTKNKRQLRDWSCLSPMRSVERTLYRGGDRMARVKEVSRELDTKRSWIRPKVIMVRAVVYTV